MNDFVSTIMSRYIIRREIMERSSEKLLNFGKRTLLVYFGSFISGAVDLRNVSIIKLSLIHI